MAQASQQAKNFSREKDIALRDLGKAVWELANKGLLMLPDPLSAKLEAVKTAERRTVAQAADVRALIDEGEAVATELEAKNKATNPVALKNKRR
jgi:hypothetical protein